MARRHGYEDAVHGKPLDRSYSWRLGSPTDTTVRSAYQRGYEDGQRGSRVGAEKVSKARGMVVATTKSATGPVASAATRAIGKVPAKTRPSHPLVERAAPEAGRGRSRRARKAPRSRASLGSAQQQAEQLVVVFRAFQRCEKQLKAARRADKAAGAHSNRAGPLELRKAQLEERLVNVSRQSTLDAARRLGASLSKRVRHQGRRAPTAAREIAERAAGPGRGPNQWAARVKGGAKNGQSRPWVTVLSGGLPEQGKRR
jgi:hypothetical protein